MDWWGVSGWVGGAYPGCALVDDGIQRGELGVVLTRRLHFRSRRPHCHHHRSHYHRCHWLFHRHRPRPRVAPPRRDIATTTGFTKKVAGLLPLALPCPREAHFWYTNIHEVQDESLLGRYTDLLSPCERQDILSIKDSTLKKRTLLTRVLLRTTLSRYTNSQMKPASLKFGKNKFGKPEVVWQDHHHWNPPPIHFNISHSSSLIACGVTAKVPIGIDVEEKERKIQNSITTFAKRCFSPQEAKLLEMISDPEIQRHEFIKLWTLKEAYVKALGRGFSAAPFKTFTIRIKKNKIMEPSEEQAEKSVVIVEDVGDPINLTTNWHFSLFELADSHYASICLQKNLAAEGEKPEHLRLLAWRTIPLFKDEQVHPKILL